MALALGFAGTSAFADGFRCEGDSSTLRVKLYNQVQPEKGTRNPATMVISDAHQGTLLVASGDEIRKHNRQNTVQYVVEGNKKLGAETAILQVAFKQGRETIAEGDEVDGQLILVSEEGDREVFELSCARYKKQ